MNLKDSSVPVRGSLLCLAVAVGLGCRRGTAEIAANKGQTQPPPAASAVTAGGPPAAIQPAGEALGDAGEREPAIPAHQIGMSAISDVHEVKLDTVKYCGKAPNADDPSSAVLLGAKVQIRAKTDKFFVDPRHASLREGGIIYSAKLDPTVPGCSPALKPISLRKDGVAAGFIVFELPRAWQEIFLDFQPVRWGGAGLVRFAVPRPTSERSTAR